MRLLAASLPSQSRFARQGRVAAPSVCFAAALSHRHALSVCFAATSPMGRGTGVPVRPTRDEQSLLYPETVVPCGLDSQQLDKGYCPEAAAPVSEARSFAPSRALGVQRRVARHASGSPFGGAGERSETERACRHRGREVDSYRKVAPKRYSLYTDTSLVYPESMIK